MHLCSNFSSFEKVFARLKKPVCLVITSDNFCDYDENLKLNELCKRKHHLSLNKSAYFNNDALHELKIFFNESLPKKKDWHFSYQSKVFLSIRNSQQLFQIFLIHSYLKRHKGTNLIVYCSNKRIRNFIEFIFSYNKRNINLEFPKLYAWFRFLRTLIRVLINRAPKVMANTLIFTLKISNQGKDNDYYFGDLPSVIQKTNSTIFIYFSAGNNLKLIQNKKFFSIESFSSTLDVISAWFNSFFELKRIFQSKKKKYTFEDKVSRYLALSEITYGDFFYNVFLSNSFKRIFNDIKPNTLLYPFENRSWEKLLLRSAYVNGTKYRVGYQHSSITPRHLALEVKENELDRFEIPTKIITTGKFTYDWLKSKSPLLSSKLVSGGSLRKVKKRISLPKKKGILVAISSSQDEARKILIFINNIFEKISIPIIIRTHPTLKINKFASSLIWGSNVFFSDSQSLAADLNKSHVVLYSSSTVVIEGMLSGRLPIFLNINDYPSGDPLFGNALYNVSSEADFLESLKKIDKKNKFQLKKLQLKAKKFANLYLKNISPVAFLNIVHNSKS